MQPQPREPVTILGAQLAKLISFSEVGIDHALRVSAVSLSGAMTIGLCADPDVVEDLDGLAAAMGEELSELRAHAA